MRRAVVALLIALPTAACGLMPSGYSPGDMHTQTLRGNYQRIASCAYQNLAQSGRAGPHIRKIDFPDRKQVRLAGEGSEVEFWRIELRGIDDRTTELSIPQPTTAGGFKPETLLPSIMACEAP